MTTRRYEVRGFVRMQLSAFNKDHALELAEIKCEQELEDVEIEELEEEFE